MSLERSEQEGRIYNLRSITYHLVKIWWNSVQQILRLLVSKESMIRQFRSCRRPTESFNSSPRKLRTYWTEVHKISTRSSGIIAAVRPNACIAVAKFQFILKRQCIEWRWCQSSVFLVPRIGYHSNVLWTTTKWMTDLSFTPIDLPNLKIWWRLAQYFLRYLAGKANFWLSFPKLQFLPS